VGRELDRAAAEELDAAIIFAPVGELEGAAVLKIR
jgi:hypothetical protein